MSTNRSTKEKLLIIRKNLELTAILEVSRILSTSFDLDANLTTAMQILSDHLEMQRGCVFLKDSLSNAIRIVAAHGLTQEAINRGQYRIGEGIVGRVIETGAPMFIPNIGEEPKFLNKTDSRPDKRGISFLCMPIKIKDEILGVLSVDRIYSQEHGDVDDDLRVLSIVSTFIGQFIQLWKHYRKSESDRESLISQLKEKYSLPNIIGKSERFQSVLKSVMKVACTDTTVLLLGESGTGKELIARTLHYQSYREKGNFVAVNVAALPENLIEVELFGSEKGAYTGANIKREGRFANANGGTLFLDEIGELPLPLQAKLLRVLQERIFERIGSSKPIKVDVRVIAATNKNLQKEVAVGNFREDLFWRLNVVPIVLPPLRERKEDIPLLLNYYLDKFNQVYQKNIRFSSEACEALKAYHWPGNIRELANTVERLIIMAEENSIRESDISMEILYPAEVNPTEKSVFSKADTTLGSEIERLERERIVNALKQHNYIQHKAASAIGITPRQLGYKLKKYGIAIKGID